MKRSLFSISILALAFKVFAAPDPNFHVYIAFGQSNMEGQAEVIEANRVKNERFKILASTTCSNMGRTLGEWAVAVPPLFHCYTGLSPADYFGKTMADSLPGVTIGVIPVAVAGSSIKLFDKAQYESYLSTAESYMQQKAADYGGNPYGRIIDLAKEAQKVGVIKGILMHQGETDAYSDTWATTVKKVYSDMLSDLGLSADTVPLLVGEVLQGGQCASANSQIRSLPNKISTAHVVSSDGCTASSDNLHFDNAGYQLLGKRYAQTMLSLLSKPSLSSSSNAQSSSSSQAEARIPFQERISIPGKLEAENYDLGGQNIAYYDINPEDAPAIYRTDNAGIDSSGGSFFYGWTQAGEWLKYSVDVKQAGEYIYTVRVASELDGGEFTLSLGETQIATISVPNTGSFTAFEEIQGTTTALPFGENTLTLTVNSPYFNVDWISFTIDGSAKIPTYQADFSIRNYTVFDLNGKKVAQFRARSDAKNSAWNALRKRYPQGHYTIRESIR